MLAVVFFCLIFSSLVWLVYSLSFVADSLAGISFFDAGVANVILYSLLVCMPIFLLWAVFGYVNQYIYNRLVGKQLSKLMGQMKKNQDYSDLIARALIEAEQHIKDGFVLNKADLLISDMNELLSEVIKGCKLASPDQIENLWAKVQHGGKWSFGKVIIEVNNTQPDFKKRILDRCLEDNFLGGAIMEFCARYDAVVKMLENHDKDRLFLDMMETGVMGKVFSILTPVAAELHRGRSIITEYNAEQHIRQEDKAAPDTEDNTEEIGLPNSDHETGGFLKKINIFKTKDIDEVYQPEVRDPFSIALERSFSDQDDEENIVEKNNDEIINAEPTLTMSDTQKTLDSLKEEWSGYKPSSENTENDEEKKEDDLVYPFGGWSNEENYHK